MIYFLNIKILCQHIQNPLQIFRRVYRNGFRVRDADLYVVSVFYPAQLFQRFGFFEHALRQSGYAGENFATVCVQTYMLIIGMRALPFGSLHSSQVRNYGPAEIQCIAAVRNHDLGRIGVENVFAFGKRLYKRRYFCRRVVEQRFDGRKLFRGNERLVALNVYHDIKTYARLLFRYAQSLGAAVGAAFMVGRGHGDIAAETSYFVFYTRIVGRNPTMLENHARAFIDAANHRLALYVRQRFARETRRGVPGRYYCYEFHTDECLEIQKYEKICQNSIILSSMTKDKSIFVFSRLGQLLGAAVADKSFGQIVRKAVAENPWFTEYDIRYQIESVCTQMLDADKLYEWLSRYSESKHEKKVLVIMAGNIPMVGFFDLMCVLASGNRAVVKTSSKDSVLIAYIIGILKDIYPDIPIDFYDGGIKPDALVAMGGDNAVRLFRQKYEGIPMLLRGNRCSVAVLDGTESNEEIAGLAEDITSYSGLGCRNVGLLFLPNGYDISNIVRSINCTEHINKKIINNYTQLKAVLEMNGVRFTDCVCRIMVERGGFPEAISQVNYVFYDSLPKVADWLAENDSSIQCVEGHLNHSRRVDFGQSQNPSLADYPDGEDTMKFLSNI